MTNDEKTLAVFEALKGVMGEPNEIVHLKEIQEWIAGRIQDIEATTKT